MSAHNQVFSAMSPKRWRIVQWTTRTTILLVIVAISLFVVALNNPNKPELPKNFTTCAFTKDQLAKDTTISWGKTPYADSNCCHATRQTLLPLSNPAQIPMSEQVRAVFFVNWDPQSYYSLAANIEKINMVLPEWLFIGEADTIVCTIDATESSLNAYKLLQKHPEVSVMPMLSNYWNHKWNDQSVKRIVQDKEKRNVFIQNLIHKLKKHGFKGINVDIENVGADWAVDFHEFMKELSEQFHQQGFMVSQDVIPFNNEYDIKQLDEYNDLMFIMAYNQHFVTGEPGAIADQKWVEGIMDSLASHVNPRKMVLCMPTFGIDWGKKGVEGQEITYRVGLSIAQEAKTKVTFNPTTYNLEFEYIDDEKIPHKVFFTDAATNFNQLRAVHNFNWRGSALWRLGAEDPRLWAFYDKDLSIQGLKNNSFDIHNLQTTIAATDVDYVGYGEVMDILSQPTEGNIRFEIDKQNQIISEEFYDKLPTDYIVQRFGKSADRKLVLTFDDGPDPLYTPQILDILQKEGVPATFFVVGQSIERYPRILKRIFNEGHEIGNHTFTHPNLANVWEPWAEAELMMTRRSIESITGHSTLLFRPPYNAYPEPQTKDQLAPFIIAQKHNYLAVNESIDPLDWQKGIHPDTILARIEEKMKLDYGHVILLHDAGGKREATIAALPNIIRHFKAKGYEFVSIANMMGKEKADLMPIIQDNQSVLTLCMRAITDIVLYINDALYWIFYIAVGLAIARTLFILVFAILQKRKERKEIFPEFTPPLSIIVPAYNEQVGVVSTIESLLQQDYPDFEIVFVDDGSKDDTYIRVKEAYPNHKFVKVFTKPNGGKASALNFGLKHCSHDFVMCIDADTQLAPNALTEIAKPFANPQIGAVAGNVKVGNKVNMLTHWQSLEYTTAQNFDRLAFAYLNCITVVPGAIGAFRRKAIGIVGSYETDTLAEDCDLTVRVLRKGYRIAQNNKAMAITEAPETYPQFMKQRFRWCFGIMQAFWKSKHVLFNKRYGTLGWVAFPNILIFGLILPLLAPIADASLLLNLLGIVIEKCTIRSDAAGLAPTPFWEKYQMLFMYLSFMSIDLVCGAVALRFERENLWQLWRLFPQRIVYRVLMYSILYKSYIKALKGELQGWGVLKRTGSMGQIVVQGTPSVQKPSEHLPMPQIGLSTVGGKNDTPNLDKI